MSRPMPCFAPCTTESSWGSKRDELPMRVAERLEKRESSWRELDRLVARLSGRHWRRPTADEVLRLGELYRATCTDLMLAEEHDLPRETVANLQSLVRRAHNVVYCASGFDFRDLGRA